MKFRSVSSCTHYIDEHCNSKRPAPQSINGLIFFGPGMMVWCLTETMVEYGFFIYNRPDTVYYDMSWLEVIELVKKINKKVGHLKLIK